MARNGKRNDWKSCKYGEAVENQFKIMELILEVRRIAKKWAKMMKNGQEIKKGHEVKPCQTA